MSKILIAPSILSANYAIMGEEIKSLEKCGADYIHVDVMDGTFVENLNFGHRLVEDIRKVTTLPLDVHLMIVNPEKHIEKFAKAGADIITVHYEVLRERAENCLNMIKSFGKKCGIAINPDMPVKEIEKIIPLCDMVLLMSVFPGKGGQKFIPSSIDRLKEIKKIIDFSGKDIDLEIDGGVTEENVSEIKRSGANVLVAGSTVFKSSNRAATIAALRNL